MVSLKLRFRRLFGNTATGSNTTSNNVTNDISPESYGVTTTFRATTPSSVIRKQSPATKPINLSEQQPFSNSNVSNEGYYRYIRLLASSFGASTTASSSSASIFSNESTELASVVSLSSDDLLSRTKKQLDSPCASSYDSPSIFNYGPDGTDPFADVRKRMESLSSKNTNRQLKLLQQQLQHAGSFSSHELLEIVSDCEEEGEDDSSQDGDDNTVLDHVRELDAEKDSTVVAWVVYLGWTILIILGRMREYIEAFLFHLLIAKSTEPNSASSELYAPLLQSWESFFTRRIYVRFHDCFNRPIASNPGSKIDVLERVSSDDQISMDVVGPLDESTPESAALLTQYRNEPHFTLAHDGSIARRCLNLGSYNYLGFGDDWAKTCAPSVKHSLTQMPVSSSSSPQEFGTTSIHRQLEETVARFLGKEDAVVFNMGFNTNATIIPALVTRGDLVISDKLNHTSIVTGARSSGAAIKIFRHNDMQHLEKILRESVLLGRPRSRRPWNKILVIVEGIYSMEGEFADLKQVVKICQHYGAYIYLDEAHSIGATGVTGRGCTEVLGVNTSDIDIMMGTFTKSYGAMGGYVAGDRDTISILRQKCVGSTFHNALSPTVCQQVVTSFKIIMGEDGTDTGRNKLHALRDNSNYFRMRLREMGLLVLGQYDSPVMPVMVYHPSKLAFFSRELLKRGVAVVVVGFPAVPLLTSRARICMSAAHSRQDLDYALEQIRQVSELLEMKYTKTMSETLTSRLPTK